jgi:hypothetical protein
MSQIEALRREFHSRICAQVIYLKDNSKPNMADVASALSVSIARALVGNLPHAVSPLAITAGQRLESIARDFLERAFDLLLHVRPGRWRFSVHDDIAAFDQYRHLADLSRIIDQNPELRIALGEYVIRPDIVVARYPIADDQLNQASATPLVRPDGPPGYSPLRASNEPHPALHASISCKWTIRSDRSQNARTEALNLIRNRKGHTPHIAVITGEPLPGRIASLAMGTGDIDCVYHFALPELIAAVADVGDETANQLLGDLVRGRRLRDIADLPFDLAI